MFFSPQVPRFDSRWQISDFCRLRGKKKVLLRVCRLSFIIYLWNSVSYSGVFHFRWCNGSFSGCSVWGVYQPTSRMKYKSKFISVHSVKACSTSRRTDPLVLQHGIRRTWEVKLTRRPLYSLAEILPTHWVGGWEDPRASLDLVGCVPLLYSVRRNCDVVSELINNILTEVFWTCVSNTYLLLLLLLSSSSSSSSPPSLFALSGSIFLISTSTVMSFITFWSDYVKFVL